MILKPYIERKRYFYQRYKNNLKNIPDLQLNIENSNVRNGVWATSIVFGKSHGLKKIEIIKKLDSQNIPSRPFFYPLSSLPAYKHYHTGSIVENPNAYDISERGITLASHYDLTDQQLDYITDGIKSIL